ncbi:hypothetical protein ACWDTT_36315 [Streptosporangium sandarakinum]
MKRALIAGAVLLSLTACSAPPADDVPLTRATSKPWPSSEGYEVYEIEVLLTDGYWITCLSDARGLSCDWRRHSR